MSVEVALVLLLAFGAAYANGANDVSKGIATLVGSSVTDYRRAIFWGALWTGAGGLFGATFATAMVATFGSGLLASGTTPTVGAALATLAGAATWVLLATSMGLPVSTTHAMIGSLTGVAVLAYGTGGVRWDALGTKVFAPLLVSPLASLALVALLVRATRRPQGAAPMADCVCAGIEPVFVALPGRPGAARTAALVPGAARLRLSASTREACARERSHALNLTMDHLHWLTSGLTSLARGMNDAPKMVAIVLPALALGGQATFPAPVIFALVTAGMVAGSIAAGRRVTCVLAEKVTRMGHDDGFVANFVTATLVTTGAVLGLPMSTTHVSSASIIGTGAQGEAGTLNWNSVRSITLAWVVTLPGAAAIAMAAYLTLRALLP